MRAFTLIEIMVVVAIMGIILAAGIPSLYGFFHKTGVRKTMSDIEDTVRSVRQKAIMTGTNAVLVIHPRDGTLEIADGAANGYSGWAQSAKIEGTKLQALKVRNGHDDLSQNDEVDVNFYANGTCDEMIMIFLSDSRDFKGIKLDIMTAQPIPMNDAQVKEQFH
jgi:prepilin-type N-terminal cleavage/methylation domain-containing protein